MGFFDKLFGGDDKKASEIGMSPEEIAKGNRDNLLFLKQQFPMLTMDQAMGHANGGMAGLLGMGMPIFGGMIQSAYDNFDRNPAKHATAALIDQTLGEGTSTGGVQGPEVNDAYEKRIKEIMDARGVTREEAVANQARAVAAGGDLNNDGVVDNNEHGIALGQDLDGDGVRSKEEIAQWRKDNSDHFAAGGTKYGGLPGQEQTTPFGTIQGLEERRALEAQQAQQAQQAPQQQVAPAYPNVGQVQNTFFQGGPGQAQVGPAGPQTPAMPGVGVMPMPNMRGDEPPAIQVGQPQAYVGNGFIGKPQPRGRRGRAQ